MSGHEEIIDTDVSSELADSFLEYSMSVIVARALPDARDGLKPVHRRILWSMHQQGIRPSTPYKKCARVVGDVIGRYHPHGDSAVYEALVRLAQPWSMRLPLVDGHGNFGSLDDGPAAMRYTECRLAPSSMPMVEELGEDTVDMRPNYDGTESEPSVMPAAFPNLLVNGGTGIAVGMATSMPPHNLAEVVAGLHALLENQKMSLSEMMRFIPGPDLPTGGSIVGAEGFKEAYATGRGSFKMRATTSVVNVSPRRQGIEVTELPFTVGPEKVVARIKELVGQKKLQGISDVKDFSDRKTGLRLVIEVKTGFNPNAVLSELLRLTPLEESFSINNVALVDGQPRTLGLLDLCRVFLEHRQSVVRRRTEFRLRKAQARAHIVEGLLVALASIDEVVALIRSSKDAATARTKLVKRFDLSDVQADAILEMTLRRLTSLEVGKLKDELRELKKAISEFKKILSSAVELRRVIAHELSLIAETFGTPRRTKLVSGVPELTVSSALEVPDDPCLIALSTSGLIARFAREPHKGKLAKGDLLLHQVDTSLHSYVASVSASGVLSRVRALEVPDAGAKVKSQELFNHSEPVAGLVDCRPGRVLLLVTALGMVKRVRTDDLPKALDPKSIVALAPGDSVVAALDQPADLEDGDVVVVASSGQLLRFPAASVSPKGLGAGAMAGMKLPAGAQVIAAQWVPPDLTSDAVVVCVSDSGAVKISALSEFPAKGRGGAGVRAMSWRKGESCLKAAAIGHKPWVGLSASGAAVSLPQELLKRDASGAMASSALVGLGFSRFVPPVP